jgi:hypothetical protein
LLQDLVDSENVEFSVVSGDGFFIARLGGREKEGDHCTCHAHIWSINSRAWVLHVHPAATQRVRFVREPDPHAPARESLTVQFLGPNGPSLVRAHFTPLYDDQGRPLAAPFARWQELRAKYGGQDELPAEGGALQLPSGVR